MVYRRRPFNRRARKFVRRQVMRPIKKRYVRKSGNLRIGKIASDLMYIKSSLNTERKHVDTHVTSLIPDGQVQNDPQGNPERYGTLVPTKTTPKLVRINLPVRGTAYNQRVGNQIKISHISVRIQAERLNTTNSVASVSWKAFLFYAKSGDDHTPTAADLFEQDMNGAYSPVSYRNQQEFRKYYTPKYLSCGETHRDTMAGNSQGQDVTIYKRMNQKQSTGVKFQNGSDYVAETYRPYLMFLSDDGSAESSDTLKFTAHIRVSYVDN